MRYFLNPLRLIYFIYAATLFVLIMLLLFPFVCLATLFGRIRGGNIIYRLCSLWADLWFPLIFVWPKISYESPHDKSKAYIFVSNHIAYFDSAFLVKVYRQPVRPLGKVEMAKIPIFGFIYKHAIVTVDRTNAEERAKSIRILRSILHKGISVLIFPEGTLNMTRRPLKDFYDGAFRIAIETQTPIKPVLFLDDYDRMNYESIFSLTPGRCRAVYLDEIPVAGLTPADAATLKSRVYLIMEKKLIEYKASWIREPADKNHV